MRKNDDNLLWKNIENFGFYYPLYKIWSRNSWLRKTVLILWALSVLLGAFVAYLLIYNKVSNNNYIILLFFVIGIILLLIGFLLFNKCKFSVWIYEKWIMIGSKMYSYAGDLKEVKLYHCIENEYECMKFIYTEIDGGIITEIFLWDPRMLEIFDKLQKILQEKWFDCNIISNLRNVDISGSIEYKAYFGFFSTWKLLSFNEKRHRIKYVLFWFLLKTILVIFMWYLYFWIKLELYEIKLSTLLIIVLVMFIIFVIRFIRSIGKFYARKENNKVFIYTWYWGDWFFLLDNYVLSKIKANYWIFTKWNVEWISLTIKSWWETTVYKRLKNEEVERFCNDLLAESKKRKTFN